MPAAERLKIDGWIYGRPVWHTQTLTELADCQRIAALVRYTHKASPRTFNSGM